MPIRNDPEFDAVLRADFTEIINEVVEEILKLVQESIEENVYGAGTPNYYVRYKMDGGLQGSFIMEEAKGTMSGGGYQITGKVDQDPMRMAQHISGDSSDFVHGSEFYATKDVRKFLTDWIVNGRSGPIFGGGFWMDSRDFWQPVLNMLTDGTIDRKILTRMIGRGMSVITR